MSLIIAIPDTHFPYHCQKTLEKIVKHIDKVKPDYVVQLGDLYDCFSWGKYPKLFRVLPEDELIEGREYAEEMWEEIRLASSKTKCVQIRGNHDERPIKRLMEKCPELEPFMHTKDFFTFDKVKTVFDTREGYEIDDILFIHGFLSKLGAHALHFNKRVVRGHSHRAGIVFFNRFGNGGDGIWEAECGYLGATDAMPFRFTPSTFTQWRRGIGEIDNGVPRFIPL